MNAAGIPAGGEIAKRLFSVQARAAAPAATAPADSAATAPAA